MEESALSVVIKRIFEFGPLLFAFGFLAPLITQTIMRSGWSPPFGLTALATGLIIAGLLGATAQIRGRWI